MAWPFTAPAGVPFKIGGVPIGGAAVPFWTRPTGPAPDQPNIPSGYNPATGNWQSGTAGVGYKVDPGLNAMGYTPYTAQAPPPTSIAPYDTTAEEEMRRQQLALAKAATMQSIGAGPNLASEQLRVGLGSEEAAQAGMAVHTAPMDAGAARRQAAESAGAIAAQGAAPLAQTRAQEELAAKNQLTGIQAGMSQQDLSAALGRSDVSKYNVTAAQDQYQFLNTLAAQQADAANRARLGVQGVNLEQADLYSQLGMGALGAAGSAAAWLAARGGGGAAAPAPAPYATTAGLGGSEAGAAGEGDYSGLEDASGAVASEHGRIVTHPTITTLGEHGKMEAVVPLTEPNKSNFLATLPPDARHEVMLAAMKALAEYHARNKHRRAA